MHRGSGSIRVPVMNSHYVQDISTEQTPTFSHGEICIMNTKNMRIFLVLILNLLVIDILIVQCISCGHRSGFVK